MNYNIMKNYTDIEQSKKLEEILSLERADHHYVRQVRDSTGKPVDRKWSTPKYGNPNSSYAIYIVQNFSSYEKIPCWSLAALLDVLNKTTYFMDEDASVNLSSYKTIEWDLGIDNSDLELVTESNPIDACYEMIIKLYELNLL